MSITTGEVSEQKEVDVHDLTSWCSCLGLESFATRLGEEGVVAPHDLTLLSEQEVSELAAAVSMKIMHKRKFLNGIQALKTLADSASMTASKVSSSGSRPPETSATATLAPEEVLLVKAKVLLLVGRLSPLALYSSGYQESLCSLQVSSTASSAAETSIDCKQSDAKQVARPLIERPRK